MRQFEAALIRPTRVSDVKSLLCESTLDGMTREDFTLGTGRGGESLQCSFYRPSPEEITPRVCLVMCHPNAGSRGEGIAMRSWVRAMHATLCAFDFAGCGER